MTAPDFEAWRPSQAHRRADYAAAAVLLHEAFSYIDIDGDAAHEPGWSEVCRVVADILAWLDSD